MKLCTYTETDWTLLVRREKETWESTYVLKNNLFSNFSILVENLISNQILFKVIYELKLKNTFCRFYIEFRDSNHVARESPINERNFVLSKNKHSRSFRRSNSTAFERTE